MKNKRFDVIGAIEAELDEAKAKYMGFNSNHEGYAVILEELDELWDIIKASKLTSADGRMKKECIQIAAMAIRFIEDLCE